jgi:hypothetical protein
MWNTCHPSETTVGPAIGACSDSGTSTTSYGASRHNLDHRGDLQRRLHSLQSGQDALPIVSSLADVAASDALGRGTPHRTRPGQRPSAPVRCGDGPV